MTPQKHLILIRMIISYKLLIITNSMDQPLLQLLRKIKGFHLNKRMNLNMKLNQYSLLYKHLMINMRHHQTKSKSI